MNETKTLKRIIVMLLVIASLSGVVAVSAESTQQDTKVESIIVFGHYEQDNITENGPEEIEWIVLDKVGDKVLLLSKYGLDSKQYHTHYESITWENCSLRKWLNDEFLNTAFSKEEQAAILLTDVDNSQSQGFSEWADVSGGNDTQDRIFLLSCAEAEKYLGVTADSNDNLKARVAPTAYAIAHGASINNKWLTAEGKVAGRWWLRSPGRHPYRAAHVYGAGSLRNTHVSASNDHYGGGTVRPALWLKLK